MEHTSLSELIDALEKGTKIHIAVAFLGNCGNQKTRCRHDQAVHNQPICMAAKKHLGLSVCYRCRFFVQKAVTERRRSMAGICTAGVYEYCRPVIYDGQVRCVIFVGNILTRDSRQYDRLSRYAQADLLKTMEQSFTPQDCIRVADILESYILFLFDRYGMENKEFDPLIENIKNHIQENAVYEVSTSQLADVFGYTEKYLGRLFKSRTGESIKEYCNRIRVGKAKKMLAETKLPVSTVALQAGFNSMTYFDRVFHKITGVSPNAYRKSVSKRNR